MTTIEFCIDAKAAVLAGKDVHGSRGVEIRPSELTEQERQTLARIMERPSPRPSISGAVAVLPYSAGYPDETGRRWAVASVETVREALADAADQIARKEARQQAEAIAKAEQDAREAAEREAKVAALVTAGAEALVTEERTGWWTPANRYSHQVSVVANRPEIALLLDRAKRLAEERNAPIQAANLELAARREAEEKALAERLQAQRALWLEAHGTASQKARFARQMLAEGELLDAMRDFYLRPLDGFAPYQKLTPRDLDCHGPVKFIMGPADALTDAEFATLEAIETAAANIDGEVTCEASLHTAFAEEDDDAEQVERKSIFVTAKVGDLTFSRRYACPQ